MWRKREMKIRVVSRIQYRACDTVGIRYLYRHVRSLSRKFGTEQGVHIHKLYVNVDPRISRKRDQLNDLIADQEYFVKVISTFRINIRATGTWNTQVIAQPQQLDRILPVVKLRQIQYRISQAIVDRRVVSRIQYRAYTEDGKASALDSDIAVSTFKEYCEYYTDYGLDKVTSAEERFRTGEAPIMIADYTAVIATFTSSHVCGISRPTSANISFL